MKKIRITAGSIMSSAELYETSCSQAIWNALPLKARVSTWGDEIYFSLPVQENLDHTARELVQPGDLGYWPEGPAFCIFFGPTPISTGDEIRPASAVNIVGRLVGDPAVFRSVQAGESILVDQVYDG
ncbi:MAG TPA: cyclophilin-like fold protein [Thermodesulfobacteriota bacterium]|nr:hypothetical protein [Deltaproteobacteria bacterium]HNR13243.1 cyclophilin-like fold protein [Thermodesulfobacteriota bacterium]HNU70614.1 cyclophilin-like fold protein [Thermodesulfobacteriota bacterium]HOC38088.1 cyclophilin-like fold protein [Thermodesulfobacteriota bacterium]HQO77782.1 cyclophilin-like fold protein [Thermodesulfobacteriota bacterium]